MKKWKILICFVSLLLSIILVAGPVTSAEPVVKEWKIPFLIFLTGPFSGFGKQIKWGVDEAAKEINEAGGIAGRPLVIEYHDTGMDPAKAAAEMSKVVEDSLLIFGPVGAPNAKGALPLVVREKAFAMAVTVGTDVNLEFHPYTVHFSDKRNKIAPPSLKGWLKRNPNMKKVVQFLFAIDPTFHYISVVQAEVMKAQGIEVLPTVELGEGVDLSSVVVKAMAKNPDGFSIVTLPIDAAKILKELDKRGIKDKSTVLIPNMTDDPALYEVGKGFLEGLYISQLVNSLSDSPEWQALYGKYMKAFPEFKDPTFGMPANYDMVYMAKAAIEETGVTGDPAKLAEERDKLREYCRNIKGFPGVQYTFDMVDGIAKTPTFLFQVKNNKKKLVETFPPM
jgi:ABC-type branched-subunit amino acid transport system substrate-binding protein